MNKILSIIIPTYNMETLLPRCLESLLQAGNRSALDVLVVNDGSRDGSLDVARGYERDYPDIIQVIDKPNGNYGSTINAALPVAKGKFVRILDSDDWLDTTSLDMYISELEALDSDVDMSVSHFHMRHADGTVETIKYNVYGKEPYEYGVIYDLDRVLGDGYIRFFLMHALAYRTDMLREHSYRQSEGISYTDTQWASYPLFWARNIVFHNLVLYEYNLDREGQTMDPAVIRKSVPQLEKMTSDMLEFFRRSMNDSEISDVRRLFLTQYLRNRIRLLTKVHLLDIPRQEFDPSGFAALDDMLSSAVTEFGMDPIRLYPENKILRVDAYRYWKRHHDRLPVWVESLIHITDKVVKFLFVKLFH